MRLQGYLLAVCTISCGVAPCQNSNSAFVSCRYGKSVSAFSTPQLQAPTATLKCNEKVTVISTTNGLARIKTKKGAELYLTTDLLSSQKTRKAGNGFWRSFGQGMATGLAAYGNSAAGNSVANHKIMIFGGEGHKTYLGCLNCSQYATDSVDNKYGDHGSPYSDESIFNRYSDYGSAYSDYSACNRYANDPPVIVDESGNYYGRLTLNAYHPEIASGKKFMDWLAAVCEH